MELAKEKGAYPLFEGSDWQTGDYFENKDYDSKEWRELRIDVAKNGMRNGYLMAVAPNSVRRRSSQVQQHQLIRFLNRFIHEEKKDYKLPVVAPDLRSQYV